MSSVFLLRLVRFVLVFGMTAVPKVFQPGLLPALPVTGPAFSAVAFSTARYSLTPTFDNFVARVANGDASRVVGVYSPGVLALRVAQQPAQNPGYVSTTFGYVTQFSLAAQYGTTGLLAHNYLSGALFFRLSPGDPVSIVLGDGTVKRYAVTGIRRFQALRPTDPYSTFLDLDYGGAELSSTDLFYQVYRGNGQVVFQTCIRAYGNSSWGRLFVTAAPIP